MSMSRRPVEMEHKKRCRRHRVALVGSSLLLAFAFMLGVVKPSINVQEPPSGNLQANTSHPARLKHLRKPGERAEGSRRPGDGSVLPHRNSASGVAIHRGRPKLLAGGGTVELTPATGPLNGIYQSQEDFIIRENIPDKDRVVGEADRENNPSSGVSNSDAGGSSPGVVSTGESHVRRERIFTPMGLSEVLNSGKANKPPGVHDERRSKQAPGKDVIITSWTDKYVKGQSWYGPRGFSSCGLPGGVSCLYYHGDQGRELFNRSDLVLFRAAFLGNTTLPLGKKTPNQKWMLFETESPVSDQMRDKNWADYADTFDYVASYSHDSNIAIPYGVCVEKPSESGNRSHAAGKTKAVAWFVSHCQTLSQRELYVAELQKHIPVDIYGACGTHNCSRTTPEVCENLLRTDYKFYLAFENALCRDYITEKLYRSFQLDIVPVVYGGAAYRDLLPPHSFIDVRDFRTPEDLAHYLHRLDQDDNLYEEYFHWKSKYKCKRFFKNSFPCKLCKFAYRARTERVSKPVDLERFWGAEQNCRTVQDFRETCSCW